MGRSAYLSGSGRAVPLDDTLREGDDDDLARRLLQHVLDGRREEARLPAPARSRAEDDQIGAAAIGLLDDRLPDRPRPNGLAAHLDAVVGAEQLGLRERGGRVLLL